MRFLAQDHRSVYRLISFSLSEAARRSSREGARSSNPMRPSSHPSSNATGCPRDHSWPFGEWRRPSGASGNQNTLSAVATLAYDCRRSAYFTEQLYATLTLIDRGVLSASTRGSMHGEIGQTQFLPKSILNYGTGNLDIAANALTSTANFLRGHGWRAGAGYQPGEANFGAIQAWNAAPVYQRAIALIGQQIDGGDGTTARR
jgi:membrane-bound lytic murein transglycosylase B